MVIDFKNKFTITKCGFFQYDRGQTIEVFGTGLNCERLEFQFIQNGEQIIQLAKYDAEKDCYISKMPDEFLKKQDDIKCYIYYDTEETGQTEKIIIFHIAPREMYDAIEDEESKSILGEILDDLAELETKINNFQITEEQLNYITEQVLATFGETYATKEDLNNLTDNFATIDDLNNLDSLYTTKDETNNLIENFGKATSALGAATGNNSARISTVETELGKLKNEVGTINAELEEI